MSVTGIAINTTMFTSLIGVHGIRHPYIRAGYLVDYCLWKNGQILRFILVCQLPFLPTKLEEIISHFRIEFLEFVKGIMLGTAPFQIISIHKLGIYPNIWFYS
jgi:hypothetical protein